MKYVLLTYGDEGTLGAMPPAERAAFGDACAANQQALQQSGRLLEAVRLHGGASATTLRIQGGAVTLGDGPATPTNAQLVGLFLIDARDLNEAIRIAAQMPQTRGGPIEIRPVRE